MVIAIIILSVLLTISSIVAHSFYRLSLKYYEMALENDSEYFIDEYFKDGIKESYPCNLLISIKEDAEFEGSVFDFSKYKDKNIIALTKCYLGKVMPKDEDGNDELLKGALLPNQVVCLMKDGNYQWDFRSLM